MTNRTEDRHLIVDDDERDVVEIPLVDLASEDEQTGLVDIAQSTQTRPSITSGVARAQLAPQLEDIELRLHRLPDGTIVRPGDTVELQCPDHRRADVESSGDFLRIVRILKDEDTGDVTLRGHRYLREKYIVSKDPDANANTRSDPNRPKSGPKLNELVLHLMVREDDDRPPEVQGREDVPVAQVFRKQPIVFTDASYPFKSWRYGARELFAPMEHMSKVQRRLHIFEKGPLVCRWSRTSIISPNGRVYGGIYRHLSKKATITPQISQRSRNEAGRNSQESAPATPKAHGRTSSVEEMYVFQARHQSQPSKKEAYTFFDAYCGAGGASRGADNAGVKVVGGLDCDELAMQAWESNFPGGIPICMDASEFLKVGTWKVIGRVDILNISFPCQVYSSAHTRPGKNDEINIEQLNNIQPLVEALKPRVVVLENAFGLATFERNRPFFTKVLNAVFNAGSGYNLRYKIINIADHGLPQQRKRLVIIAAKKDIPLPPFPKPTHGPAGSGLQPYVYVGDALRIIERLGERADRDYYHQSHKRVSRAQQVYDPFNKFIDCSWSEAIKQVGNMFPPVMTEAIYRICAQTLEAFDNGFIHADDDIDDLNVTLIEKGVDIPEKPATPTSLVDLTESTSLSPYKYLSRPELSDPNTLDFSSAFAKRNFERRTSDLEQERKRSLKAEEDDDEEETPSPEEARTKRAATSSRQHRFWQEYNGKTIELSDEE
ncbi:hypothetical protein E8E11_005190 [Didymella keratinophila]|nr:hypothetical protein E8E11_005190 [Didymella keratinophila]